MDEYKWYRVGSAIHSLGGMIGNPGTIQDVWAKTVQQAQGIYASRNPSKCDPSSYAVLQHKDRDCPACNKVFCQYSWGK